MPLHNWAQKISYQGQLIFWILCLLARSEYDPFPFFGSTRNHPSSLLNPSCSSVPHVGKIEVAENDSKPFLELLVRVGRVRAMKRLKGLRVCAGAGEGCRSKVATEMQA